MFVFTSKYALTLYEAVCLRANLRVSEQVFGVDDFRALLGAEAGKYEPFKNLEFAHAERPRSVMALPPSNSRHGRKATG